MRKFFIILLFVALAFPTFAQESTEAVGAGACFLDRPEQRQLEDAYICIVYSDGSIEAITQFNDPMFDTRLSPDGTKVAFNLWADWEPGMDIFVFTPVVLSVDGTSIQIFPPCLDECAYAGFINWQGNGKIRLYEAPEADAIYAEYLLDVETGSRSKTEVAPYPEIVESSSNIVYSPYSQTTWIDYDNGEIIIGDVSYYFDETGTLDSMLQAVVFRTATPIWLEDGSVIFAANQRTNTRINIAGYDSLYRFSAGVIDRIEGYSFLYLNAREQ